MTAFLSGEMKDTVEIVRAEAQDIVVLRLTLPQNPAATWVLEKVSARDRAWHLLDLTDRPDQFFSRKERAKLFRRWPGASSMWVKVSADIPAQVS